MVSFIEINDVAAARGAARALSSYGEEFSTDEQDMPEPEFGDDKFGDAMRDNYPAEMVIQCLAQKLALGRHLSQLGDNVERAVDAYQEQDAADAVGFDQLMG